jgi:hypothetical protein
MIGPHSHNDLDPVPHGPLMNVVDRLEAVVGELRQALRTIPDIAVAEGKVGRARKGKPGRPPQRDALARFAIIRRKRKRQMTWDDIAVEWELTHPNDPVTIDTVRSAVRNYENRKTAHRA